MGNASYKEWFDETELKYLIEIFRDLAGRRRPYDVIDKTSFMSYFGLPGLFGERLFDAFGSKVNLDNFVRTIGHVSKTSTNYRIEFLFRILDLDDDGKLSVSELETILRHVPTSVDVRKAVDLYFHNSKTLDLDEFTRLVCEGHDLGLVRFVFSRIPFSPSSSSKISTRRRSIRECRRHSVSSIQTNESIDDDTFEGELYKRTRNLKLFFTRRYYYLHGNLLCYYASDRKIRPKGIVYLDSCRIESIENPSQESKDYYGFKIIPPTMNAFVRELYARSKKLRDQWIRSLRVASRNVDFDEKYNILEAIGRGRFSQVHLCHLRGTKEDRAVKITDKKIMNEKESELLRTEISVLRLVKHPNLIRLYDVFETQEAIFLVMELVTGGELYEHIVGRARFTEFECYNVVKPLLTGVAYLHELGIVHRDLKPENILCGDEVGDLKIADFGLSKFVMPSEMLKMPCGTLTYIAPEILSNEGYDKKADIYSVGVIAFLLLRGRLPFEGRSPREIVEKIQNQKLDFQDRVWSKLSVEIRDFVARLLSRTPCKRPNACESLTDPWMKLMETKAVHVTNRSPRQNAQCPSSPIRVSKYTKRLTPAASNTTTTTTTSTTNPFLSSPPTSPIKTLKTSTWSKTKSDRNEPICI